MITIIHPFHPGTLSSLNTSWVATNSELSKYYPWTTSILTQIHPLKPTWLALNYLNMTKTTSLDRKKQTTYILGCVLTRICLCSRFGSLGEGLRGFGQQTWECPWISINTLPCVRHQKNVSKTCKSLYELNLWRRPRASEDFLYLTMTPWFVIIFS